jgi:hypothetical protein
MLLMCLLCFEGFGDLMKIEVTSGAFKNGEMIPGKYTRDGDGVSPSIAWSNIPAGSKSIALISNDPDAVGGDFVHWVIFNIPPDAKGLPENIPVEDMLSDGTIQGVNDAREIGYCSPCPPSGTHRYYFKVYALDKALDLLPGAPRSGLLKAMKGHILANGELMGLYKRR